jgi:hypothetical protein
MRTLCLILFCLTITEQVLADEVQTCLGIVREHLGVSRDLRKDCPDLFDALQSQNMLESFEPPLQDGVSVTQLEFLADRTQSLHNPSPINQNGLTQLLSGILIAESADPQLDWQKALLDWLDSFKAVDYETEYPWLIRLLTAIKHLEGTMQLFFYGLISLLVIISAWMVINELFLAGFFAKLLGKQSAMAQVETSKPSVFQAIIAQQPIRDLPPKQQIASLLEQAVLSLAERNLIPRDLTLTYRQIERYISQQNQALQPSFAKLVHEAEPILYGNRPVDAQTLSRYWQAVEILVGKPVL